MWGMTVFIDYLEEAGIGQALFAESIAVTQATISRLASGKMTPSLELALKIEIVTKGAVPMSSWCDPRLGNLQAEVTKEAS